MCGISGIFGQDGTKELKVRHSINAIKHRGPDESGFFEDTFCSLGMCRLAIVDVKLGQQPSYNSDKSVVSVFNGEIYNFRDLQKMLRQRGHNVETEGDSALIPFLYQEFGLSFPKLLQGMFAIAIYDVGQKKLVLVRDRLGKKPLWYSVEKGSFKFSSEVKGLVELGIEKKLKTEAIQEFLQFGYINAPHSAFENVLQMKPATVLVYSNRETSSVNFWNLEDVKPISIGYLDAKREAERLLTDAVTSRLVAERPIGAFLSGGIDSTIVAALMQKHMEKPIHTFSIGFSEERFDESRFASGVAKSIGSIHHEKTIHPNPQIIVEMLSKNIDQPFADSSIIPTFLLSEFARQQVVVALSGDGGDEAFGGYTRYRVARLLNRINPILRLNPFNYLPTDKISNSRVRKLLKHSGHMTLAARYRGFQSFFQISDLQEIVNPDMLKNLENDDFNELWRRINVEDSLTKLQLIDIDSYLPGDLLYKVDLASMASGLEVRSPFLDYRVVEFGLSLPANLKFKGNENKHLLREIARSQVPASLIDRPKMGFGIPLNQWIRFELNQIIKETLLDRTSMIRGWYKDGKIEETISLHQQGVDRSSLIWPMFMLELWAKNWLD